MAGILLGDKGCTYKEIVDLFGNKSIEHLKSKWRSMAFDLIGEEDIQIILGKNQSNKESISDVLKVWRINNAERSTLGHFVQNLPEDWNQLKEYVRGIIWEKAECWKDLDDIWQARILQSKVRFLGLDYTLSSLVTTMEETFPKEHLPQKPFKQIWKCDELEFPIPLPKYYIKRKITKRQKLKPEIFKEKCCDIFVIEDIERFELTHQLEKAKSDEITDYFHEQLTQLSEFNVRFMVLRKHDDFNKIMGKTNYPVHRIKYNRKDKTFDWVCSIGSINLITKFLSDSCEEIKELDFIVNTLSVFNSRPVAICSSPGMGKSFLLKHIASQVKENFPERFVLYLGLEKLIERLQKAGGTINLDLVIDILANEPTFNVLGRTIVKEKMHNPSSVFEIFLDGFDEIASSSLELAKEFLKLMLNTTNMRCHIASRPHMTTELEQTVGVVSYNIAPFTSVQQVEFFCNFWSNSLNLMDKELLSRFASKVLQDQSMTNTAENVYEEIAGIPLQCYMLAEIHSEDVTRFCGNPEDDFKIKKVTNALYELYTKYMESKFQKIISEVDRELVKRVHMLYALDVLFPENTEALIIRHSLETELEINRVLTELVFSVGILVARDDLVNPEFGHRTFAEFFLAELITKDFLQKRTTLPNTWTTFVYDTVLGLQSTTQDHSNTLRQQYIYKSIVNHSSYWENKNISESNLKKLKAAMIEISTGLSISMHARSMERYCRLDEDMINEYDMVEEFDDLVCALYKLEWFQIADELERTAAYRLENCKFLHATICFFLDAVLMKCPTVLLTENECKFPVHDDLFSLLNGSSKTFMLKLLSCASGGFESLIRLVLTLCHQTPHFKSTLHIDYKGCQELPLHAANNNNAVFFEYCSEMTKILAHNEYLSANSYKNIDTAHFKMEYEHTPLHVAVSRGNYNVTEYLSSHTQINRSTTHGLWQLCLHESYQDSEFVIQQKIQILRLLELRELIVGFDKIIYDDFPHKVHCSLFIELCKLFKYIPSEPDIKTIATKVISCGDDNGSQMDNLVDWFKEIKKEKLLLTQNWRYRLLNEALKFKKIKPETFRKIFTLVDFDPNGILWNSVVGNRGEAMIKIILELTGTVNHIDQEEYRRSLLHCAVYHENSNAIKILLSNDANVNLQDEHGNTPLHLALERRPVPEIVKLLLENGSDFNAKNLKHETPLLMLRKNQDLVPEGIKNTIFKD